MFLRVAAIFTLAALASPMAAQAQSPDITVNARDNEADEQVVVCKYQMKTGSRFKEKNCKTKLQWEQMRIQQQRDAKELIDRPLVNGSRG